MSSSYSSLDWVLSHWTHFTVHRFICVYMCILCVFHTVFSALHGMPTRTSDEEGLCLSVRPSVHLSIKRVDCDKTEERSVAVYYEN